MKSQREQGSSEVKLCTLFPNVARFILTGEYALRHGAILETPLQKTCAGKHANQFIFYQSGAF